MTNKNDYIYADASVFLAYIKAETGRIEVLRPFFQQIQADGNQNLITSIISIVEVAHVGREKMAKKSILPETPNLVWQAIDTLWRDSSLVKLVDLDENIAFKARELTYAASLEGFKLKNMDALHLASAILAGAKTFLAYDGDFDKMTKITGLEIKHP